MEHLTVEEIIKYTMADKIDEETLNLLAKVNGHIRKCPECKEKIEAYEMFNEKIIEEACNNRSAEIQKEEKHYKNIVL